MTRPINKNEQWKLDGNCSRCCRVDYCKKHCKPYKRKLEAEMRRAIIRKELGI